MTGLRYSILPGSFGIARLDPGAAVPAWANEGRFVSITRTEAELSIVCLQGAIPAGVNAERGWAALVLAGPIPFSEVGVLASFLSPLAEAKISIFSISTFDTDTILVPMVRLEAALEVLMTAGHVLI